MDSLGAFQRADEREAFRARAQKTIKQVEDADSVILVEMTDTWRNEALHLSPELLDQPADGTVPAGCRILHNPGA